MKRPNIWKVTALVVGLMVTIVACSPGVPKEEVARKNQQIADLQAQVTKLQQDAAQIAELQQDATYWKQLTALYMPVPMKSMTDHRAYMLPSGTLLALHFDDMDLNKAKNLNWVAFGVPGTYCKSDQERVEKLFGKGFTHFHDLMADTHGGKTGAQGVWFVHVAVREFDAPWGRVKPGVDEKFMPTPAPVCQS